MSSSAPGEENIPAPSTTSSNPEDLDLDASYTLLNTYPSNSDYYALLSLPRSPAPTDSEIRSAYKTLTLSFHPDKQPAHLREIAERQFERIKTAYETLIDERRRVVYDLLGAEGVKREFGSGGVMGEGGEGRSELREDREVGVRAKSPEEFKRWFLGVMKRRERGVVNGLVQSRGTFTLGIDASDMISVNNEEQEVFVHFPHPKVSSYAIGCSFKAPVPTWKFVMGDDEEEEEKEEEEEQGKDEKVKKGYPQITNLEMRFNAGLSGGIRHPTQVLNVSFDDGTEEERRVPLPLTMVTQDMSLGVGVAHAFGDVASTKGLLSKRPFSFLSYSGVSADAFILPAPMLQLGLAKAITPIPGTTPFRVNLTTIFKRSLIESLPNINLGVTKQIGRRKHAFCNYASGTLEWPVLVQKILNPLVSLGLEVESYYTAAIEQSSLQVGILSLPKRSAPVATMDDDEDEDPVFEQTKTKAREIDQAAETWQFQIAATPIGGGLSLNYNRNIFSGKPVEPARSEWSDEAHYAVGKPTDPRSVRLEVSTTVGFDLSLAWNIEGIRQVGEFTRMGVGLGVQTHGLVMTISWNRLGQKIRLPISICPAKSVNADAAALAVISSWLAYCALEFGFVRPRDRKNRRRAVARKQRQLKKAIPVKRAESLQTIELMAEQVLRRQAREESQGGLVITKAEYGYDPSAKKKVKANAEDYEIANVTIPVAALVNRGQLVIPQNAVKFQILGFHDPAPLLPKKLKIWYRYRGVEHVVEARDSEGVTCPMRSHLI